NYSISGTATSGTDYTSLSGTVTFAAGSDTAIVTVVAVNDGSWDPDETVIATVTSGTGYSIGVEDTDTVVIVDSATLGFTLPSSTGSYVGVANYTTPWSSVDETLAIQDISLPDFTLTLAGVTFHASDPEFTITPSARFEYGIFVGIVFTLDTSLIATY